MSKDSYTALGVKRRINAAGTLTFLTAMSTWCAKSGGISNRARRVREGAEGARGGEDPHGSDRALRMGRTDGQNAPERQGAKRPDRRAAICRSPARFQES
jgi:hypothetical protein